MARVNREVDLAALQDNVQDVYGSWAQRHSDGLYLTVRPYDASEVHQEIDIVQIRPKPDIELARKLGHTVTGKPSYDKLSASFEGVGAIDIVKDRADKNLSTLIATLHLDHIFDTALTHNNLFVTSGGDEKFAEINDIIANPMMSRLNLGSIAVYEALVASGRVDLLLPTQAARKHGMERRALHYLASRMIDAFDERLATGVAVHWAPSGTRGKPAELEGGDVATIVKRVDDNIATLVAERMNLVVPVPVVMKPGEAAAEVLNPRAINSVDDVHTMMEEMVETATYLSGRQILYGLPEGAQYLQV